MDPEVAEELKALEAEVERARGDGPVAEGLARLELANLRILVKDYDGAEKDIATVEALAFPAPRGDVERRKQALVPGLVSHPRGKSELGRGPIGPSEPHYQAALPPLRDSADTPAPASLLDLGMANRIRQFADAHPVGGSGGPVRRGEGSAGDVAARARSTRPTSRSRRRRAAGRLADEADAGKDGEGVRLGGTCRSGRRTCSGGRRPRTTVRGGDRRVRRGERRSAQRARAGAGVRAGAAGRARGRVDCLRRRPRTTRWATGSSRRVLMELAEAHEAAHRATTP